MLEDLLQIFGWNIDLPHVETGDTVAILDDDKLDI